MSINLIHFKPVGTLVSVLIKDEKNLLWQSNAKVGIKLTLKIKFYRSVSNFRVTAERIRSKFERKQRAKFSNECDTTSIYHNFLKVPAATLRRTAPYSTSPRSVSHQELGDCSPAVGHGSSSDIGDLSSDRSSEGYSRPPETNPLELKEYLKSIATADPVFDEEMARRAFDKAFKFEWIEEESDFKTLNEAGDYLGLDLKLMRLGFSGSESIDWNGIQLPHRPKLYEVLNERVGNKIHTDCTIYIEDQMIDCHLILLQTCSKLFNNFEPFKKFQIRSDRCSAVTFKNIYSWMLEPEHMDQVLTTANVFDIYRACHYLQIKDLEELCFAFMENKELFDEDTAFLLYVQAKKKEVEEIIVLMLPRIQAFFLVLVSSEDWLKLVIEAVKDILTSNHIKINCEMEIFASAVRWLKHDWEARWPQRVELLQCVRFGHIDSWQLVDIKRNPINPDYVELAREPAISKMIDDGLAYATMSRFYSTEPAKRTLNNSLELEAPIPRNWTGANNKVHYTYRSFLRYTEEYRKEYMIEKYMTRGYRKCLSEVDRKFAHGDCLSNSSLGQYQHKKTQRIRQQREAAAVLIQAVYRGYRVRKMFDKKIGTLRQSRQRRLQPKKEGPHNKLTELFSPSKNHFASLEKDKPSYTLMMTQSITGNLLFFSDKESILVLGGTDPINGRLLLRYIPKENKWKHVSDLPEPRHHHCVQFLSGRLYVVGGCDPRCDVLRAVDTVWSFEPKSKRWFSEASLRMARRNFGLVATQGLMYAFAGQNRDNRITNTLEQFSPFEGRWKFKTPMQIARYAFSYTKYRQYIWVAGGLTYERKILDSIEGYDFKTDQWTQITKLSSPRCFSSMLVKSDSLFVTGGVGAMKLPDKSTNSSLGIIEVWDPHKLKWRKEAEMDIPRHSHAVGYLGTQIFIMGGFTTVYMKPISNVECYCTKRKAWIRGISPLPHSMCSIAAFTLPPTDLFGDSSYYFRASTSKQPPST